jgi:hypothetical protein
MCGKQWFSENGGQIKRELWFPQEGENVADMWKREEIEVGTQETDLAVK